MGKHKEWRKIAKKMRRKRIRTLKAKERDKKLKAEQESPTFQAWLKKEEELEKFEAEEKERIRKEQNDLWLENERLAKERWEEQQIKLERIKAEKLKQELKMKEEWERTQQKIKEKNELAKKEQERKKQEQAILMDRIEKYVTGDYETLPSSALTFSETQPGAQECPFFSKVAACRFRDSCSRNHIRPSISKTLLFPGFYSNFRIEHVNQSTEYDTDVGLEFEEKEIYQHFLEFYHDVLAEIKSFGTVVQFKVCSNEEPHLRGNVYVQYGSERYAIKAFRALQGRFYGGKRISVEFCTIKTWNKAICGLNSVKKCPKGSRCNFLHVFRNPNNEYSVTDREIINDRDGESSSRSIRKPTKERRWSSSPESSRYDDNSEDEFRRKDRDVYSERRSRRQSRTERSQRSQRLRSRSRSRSRSKHTHKKYKHRDEISSERSVKRDEKRKKRDSSRDRRSRSRTR
ncbi:U2 small nuclear ribonucleoprotein auxiliary factor 35 kDa subunit-related protein 2 isoform X1 [Planococcus citri]|uniref:U2 small nuclear ribonucleoprotein auxiliary factor 35 kDa subunit-related protein 2 isoform X1 n=1 Tax=Planococcus citri TaxID=170843 RepID=UPI0031F91D47